MRKKRAAELSDRQLELQDEPPRTAKTSTIYCLTYGDVTKKRSLSPLLFVSELLKSQLLLENYWTLDLIILIFFESRRPLKSNNLS